MPQESLPSLWIPDFTSWVTRVKIGREGGRGRERVTCWVVLREASIPWAWTVHASFLPIWPSPSGVLYTLISHAAFLGTLQRELESVSSTLPSPPHHSSLYVHVSIGICVNVLVFFCSFVALSISLWCPIHMLVDEYPVICVFLSNFLVYRNLNPLLLLTIYELVYFRAHFWVWILCEAARRGCRGAHTSSKSCFGMRPYVQ